MLGFVVFLLSMAVTAADVKPMTGFNLDQMKGKWYIIGFATNADWFVSHKENVKMATAMLKPTAAGGLEIIHSNVNEVGACWRMNHFAEKTNIPGCFTFYSQYWGNNNDMCVVDGKFDEFILIHTIKTKGDTSEVLNTLYGRSTDLSADLKQRFQKFCLDTGIDPENVLILPPNGEC